MINRLFWVTLGTSIIILMSTIAISSAASIEFGQTLSGSLSSTETDSYTFVASAKEEVIIRVSKTSGTFQPGIKLCLSDGSKLQDMHNSPTAEISYELPGNGTYSIFIYDSLDGTHKGDYNLYLQKAINPGNAVSIESGKTISGSIAPAEMDAYTFTTKTRNRVKIRASTTSGSLKPGIRLYAPDGNNVQKADGSSTAEISYEITEGTWTILVYDELDGSGNYNIYFGSEARTTTPASTMNQESVLTSTPIPSPISTTSEPFPNQNDPKQSNTVSAAPELPHTYIIFAAVILGGIALIIGMGRKPPKTEISLEQ